MVDIQNYEEYKKVLKEEMFCDGNWGVAQLFASHDSDEAYLEEGKDFIIINCLIENLRMYKDELEYDCVFHKDSVPKGFGLFDDINKSGNLFVLSRSSLCPYVKH